MNFLCAKRFLPFGIAVLCMLYGFCGMFGRAANIFGNAREDMSFGWLVPVFSLYVLWSRRREILESLGSPSLLGAFLCIPLLAISLIGARGLQLRLEQVAFIGLWIAIPWAFFGRRTAAYFVFPALYLAFTIPLSTFLDVVTINLRLLASGSALAVLRGFGADVVQQGTAIISQGSNPFSIDVAEPCSGLRSLFALMALTAAYAWFNQPTWLRRGFLFALSVPLAVLGNVVRIITICLFAAWTEPDFALGFYHDYSGYIVFIVAILAMLACSEFISRFAESWTASRSKSSPPAPAPSANDSSPAPALPKNFSSSPYLAKSIFALAILVPVFIFQHATPAPVVAAPPDISLPASLPLCRTDGVRYCHNEQCSGSFLTSRLENDSCPVCSSRLEKISLGEKTLLPPDTALQKSVYHSPLGVQFLVSAVIGGRTKSSIHRPELCMPAQGFVMSSPQDLSAAGRPFRAIHLSSKDAPPSVIAYTFFNQEGMRTSSHVRRILADTLDRSLFNRIDRWVMITVSASAPDRPGGFSLDNPADAQALVSFLESLSKELP